MNRLRRWQGRRRPRVWYHRAYRLPAASVEAAAGMDPRRADLARYYLRDAALVPKASWRTPTRVRYTDLARVHSEALLRSLHQRAELARVFAVDPSDIHVDEVLRTFRLACGGTLEAARACLRGGGTGLNLLGGFHHAGPERAAGMCPVNDIAVAVAALREEGFGDPVAVLDLDAHPPDGTAECFAGDRRVWIGSLSGCDWGPLPGVDETLVPPRCDEGRYLRELDALLGRLPRAGLVFVVAGGDVLDGDASGSMALTLHAAQRRDLLVLRALGDTPSVWLPGGGYSRQAWRLLAGTGAVLSLRAVQPLPADYDPLERQYAEIAADLSEPQLAGDLSLTQQDVLDELGVRLPRRQRLLGYYTAEGIEYALFRYGILRYLQRLGYVQFRVTLDHALDSDRFRLHAQAEGVEHLLIECAVAKQTLDDEPVLYVQWLTLRDPRRGFSRRRPGLPGQEEPGLGLAQEAGRLLGRMAARLGLAAVVFRPAWFHIAHAASRAGMRFVDPRRQGRFQALARALGHIPLLEATRALADRRVLLNDQPYTWEAELMARFVDGRDPDPAAVRQAQAEAHFTLLPHTGSQKL